ncbi:hypothetical protein [Noviherbaspirillum sp.]|uniref:hypothetical protein n=1 Tax=Noviherbaspirillum sp. TaxID=1926288 RepID=UPI002B4A8C49|nr:hypothetical protein [Noviherbaspirillum sp.]HJV80673.1 hypothetical protein [Noviherbaspirillum sp.]
MDGFIKKNRTLVRFNDKQNKASLLDNIARLPVNITATTTSFGSPARPEIPLKIASSFARRY